ncbi:MAG: glutamine synthetase adenylyltransferase [Fuerstiella sp.]
MFPRFDNLTDLKFELNRDLLNQMSLSDADQATRCLHRIADAFRRSLLCGSGPSESGPSESGSSESGSRESGPSEAGAAGLANSQAEDAIPARNQSFSPSVEQEPQWYQSLKRILQEAPSPETILESLDHYVKRSRDVQSAFLLLEETPRALEILARLSCSSSFLTQILVNDPQSLASLARERRTAEMKSREDFRDTAMAAISKIASGKPTLAQKLDALRAFQRREILRIGMCDAFGLFDLKFVTLQISLLADALVQVCLKFICDEAQLEHPPFSVIALGKLGGEELNYSSDIDLVLIADANSTSAERIARQMIDLLSQNAATGFLYRIDMRLRPWGDAGPLVTTPDAYHDYLQGDAELWEKQALLKARLIAGINEPGRRFLKRLPELLFSESEADVLNSIRRIKGFIEERLRKAGRLDTEVKLGSGSIRDVEFMVQALQLLNGGTEPRLYSPNTLDALVRLAEHGILNAFEYRQLREGYIFLRTVEHALQLTHNQQIHQLPDDHRQLNLLAQRLDYSNRLDLMERFDEHRKAVRRTFQQYFGRNETSNRIQRESSANPQEPSHQEPSHQAPGIASSTAEPTTFTGCHDEYLKEVFGRPTHEQQANIDDMLEEVSEQNCCVIQITASVPHPQNLIITIVGLETAEALSMICGCLVKQKLDIREAALSAASQSAPFEFQVKPGHFVGFLIVEPVGPIQLQNSTSTEYNGWLRDLTTNLKSDLSQMLLDLRNGQGQRMREQLVEIICERVKAAETDTTVDAELEILFRSTPTNKATILLIHANDSPGFFLELSGALALFGYRIQTAQLGSSSGRILDVLKITGSDGLPIETRQRRDELVAAVTIVKQFTHWLPNNSDPLNALLRFRDLLKSLMAGPARESHVARLNQPTILRDVGRVLGLSRFLWEDFLMVRSQDFLDFMDDQQRLKTAIPVAEINSELAATLSSVSAANTTGALNRFKDRHLFRIDLRHVLGHCPEFGQFSREITALAETIVTKAAELAWDKLVQQSGEPINVSNSTAQYCLVALGKFGGIEMGFASDLELFLVYDSDGQTNGKTPVSNAIFFERLVTLLTETISARHKGIFEIDLRMRPHGQAGSAAVSLQTFREYFGEGGDCWPYERQSLVKLRPIAGSLEFLNKIRQLRDSIVYDDRPFDFGAMRAFREQQVRQLVRAGTTNAKLSDGGLVDSEYAVQALQITFGKQHKELRSPNTMTALNAALNAKFLSPEQHQSVSSAYRFLREVIDCLRMVRGNAMDLTVPIQDSPDFTQLARRMHRVHESEIPLEDLENQMQVIREFSSTIFDLCDRQR